ncbi:hypothetical protein ASPVEDRAFT_224728 [Aspergillus versicolor CBS 583.65]|uniref:Uncharacterized protein n=1 Tax=Aspergillus versicolor CBS 583.65 TaxID=1036611 RepID=A0A1L9P3W5_ASPVE|nr:uncharacterized protein ASPVEDRAFT_224728 [Aspergillus versicolor CBS 583.65]OJI96227.1 hypothetical protein ASPVEDRAFT_224728 [Aspergillus versicolor CBS 583.65]
MYGTRCMGSWFTHENQSIIFFSIALHCLNITIRLSYCSGNKSSKRVLFIITSSSNTRKRNISPKKIPP